MRRYSFAFQMSTGTRSTLVVSSISERADRCGIRGSSKVVVVVVRRLVSVRGKEEVTMCVCVCLCGSAGTFSLSPTHLQVAAAAPDQRVPEYSNDSSSSLWKEQPQKQVSTSRSSSSNSSNVCVGCVMRRFHFLLRRQTDRPPLLHSTVITHSHTQTSAHDETRPTSVCVCI
jgi:hypothetical protein